MARPYPPASDRSWQPQQRCESADALHFHSEGRRIQCGKRTAGVQGQELQERNKEITSPQSLEDSFTAVASKAGAQSGTPARDMRKSSEESGHSEANEDQHTWPRAYRFIMANLHKTSVEGSQLNLGELVKEITDDKTPQQTAKRSVRAVADHFHRIDELHDETSLFLYCHLLSNATYREICSQDRSVKRCMRGVVQRLVKARPALDAMTGTLAQIRDYVGSDFFEANVFDEMYIEMAEKVWELCTTTYSMGWDFEAIFMLLNQIRIKRIVQDPSRGVLENFMLKPCDVDNTYQRIRVGCNEGTLVQRRDGSFEPGLETLCEQYDTMELRRYIVRASGFNPLRMAVDSHGVVHFGPEYPDIIQRLRGKPAELGACIPHTTSGAVCAKVIPRMFEQVGGMRWSQVWERRKIDQHRSKAVLQGGKGVEQYRLDDKPVTTGDWTYATSLDDYRLGSEKVVDGLVERGMNPPLQYNLSKVRDHRAGRSAGFALSADLATQLFERPTSGVVQLLRWQYMLHRSFEDPSVEALDWATEVQQVIINPTDEYPTRIPIREIIAAIRMIEGAIIPLVTNGGNHAMLKSPGIPYMSLFGLHTMLHTFHAASEMQQPAWVKSIQTTVNTIIDHHGEACRFSRTLGVDTLGRNINFYTPLFTMNTLVADADNAGWLDARIIHPAMQYFLRAFTHVQSLEPESCHDYRDGRIQEVPGHGPIETFPVVLVPLNLKGEYWSGHHWTLLILNFNTTTWEYLDSLDGTRVDHDFMGRLVGGLSAGRDDGTNWRRGSLRAVTQDNKNDCGIWVVANAVAYANSGQAAGRQTTANLRLWFTNVLAEAALSIPGEKGLVYDNPAPWATLDQRTVGGTQTSLGAATAGRDKGGQTTPGKLVGLRVNQSIVMKDSMEETRSKLLILERREALHASGSTMRKTDDEDMELADASTAESKTELDDSDEDTQEGEVGDADYEIHPPGTSKKRKNKILGLRRSIRTAKAQSQNAGRRDMLDMTSDDNESDAMPDRKRLRTRSGRNRSHLSKPLRTAFRGQSSVTNRNAGSGTGSGGAGLRKAKIKSGTRKPDGIDDTADV